MLRNKLMSAAISLQPHIFGNFLPDCVSNSIIIQKMGFRQRALPDAEPRSDRPRCCGCKSNF